MILVDATPLQSEHRSRGVGTYVSELVRGLAASGRSDIWFAAVSGGALPSLIPPERAVVGFRRHHPAQVYWAYNEWFLRRAIHRSRARLFHATDFNGLVIPRGVRAVTTLYDLTPLREGLDHRRLSGRLSDLRWTTYYRRKLPRASIVIAISRQAARDATSMLGLSEDRLVVIPLGVDRDRFKPVQPEGDAAERPYLLFIGARAPNKNLDRTLEAFARVAAECPSPRLVLAGPWRQIDRDWLERVVARLEISTRVELAGFIAPDDLPVLYSGAIALLFPSLEEGFGLPVLEAMACGTPVVTSDRGVLAEIAGDAALKVDPYDVDHLAAVIRSVVADPDLRRVLSGRGLARAAQFTWASTVARTLEVYDSLLSEPRRPAG